MDRLWLKAHPLQAGSRPKRGLGESRRGPRSTTAAYDSSALNATLLH
jgi:hypothetical protein